MLLSVASASVFIGTLYPLFMDALGMGKLSVGPPYFEAVFVPLMTLTSPDDGPRCIGALEAVQRARIDQARALGIRCGGQCSQYMLPLIFKHWTPMIALGLLLSFWVIASLVVSLQQRWGGPGPFMQRVRSQSLSYYGMQLAHLGVAVFIIGVTVVKGYETERDVRMNVGDTVDSGGYIFRFDGVNNATRARTIRRSRRISPLPRMASLVTVLRTAEAPLQRVRHADDGSGDRYRHLPRPVCLDGRTDSRSRRVPGRCASITSRLWSGSGAAAC